MSALAALLLVFVLPSVAGAVLLSGSARPVGEGHGDAPCVPDLALSRGFACGLATWLLGSGLLTRTVGLTAGSAWTWSALVGAGSLVVLLLPRNLRRLGAVLAPLSRRLAGVGGLTALVFLPLGVAILRTSWSPLGSTPWYYYGLARQVAEAGSIPATSIEFGTATPFLNDYHLFTTGTAMLLVQHPGGPMSVITTVTLVGALLVGVGAVALTSALGGGRTTSLFAVPIAMAAGLAPIRLAAYRAEGFALGLELLMVALGVDWLRNRNGRSLLAAALLAATLSQVHGIAALSGGVMIAAAALVSVVSGPRGEQLRRSGLALAGLGAAVLVAGVVFHEASGTVHAGGLVDRGGLADPTWEFYRAARGEPPSMPPSNGSMIWQTVRQLYDWQQWWFLPLLLLAIVGLWLRRRDAVVRQLVSFTLLSLVGLLAIASVFMFGWQGYVPRRTGASRLFLEASLLGPPLVAIGLGCLGGSVWSWWLRRREDPGPRRRRLVVLTCLTLVSACGVASMVRVSRYDDGQAPTQAQLAVWRSLPLTGDDVVLANGYTEGFIPDVTGAQGLLDGRAPYTFDALLRHADQLFRGAQAFYADPAQNWHFLAENDVTWVVVGKHGSYSLGTGNIWKSKGMVKRLQGCSGLRRYPGDPTLTVFRVVDPGPGGCRKG